VLTANYKKTQTHSLHTENKMNLKDGKDLDIWPSAAYVSQTPV